MIALAWQKCLRKVPEFEHFLEPDGVHTILVDTTLFTDITTPLMLM